MLTIWNQNLKKKETNKKRTDTKSGLSYKKHLYIIVHVTASFRNIFYIFKQDMDLELQLFINGHFFTIS